VPQTVPEIDAVLAEHLAQLRNAVRYTMQTAIDDGSEIPNAATSPLRAITRMIQVNLGIAKVLRRQPDAGVAKVHGVMPTRMHKIEWPRRTSWQPACPQASARMPPTCRRCAAMCTRSSARRGHRCAPAHTP